ncbi:hypothetical protein A5881_003503 [Enterococcus termitis]|nr:hypothetical protein A5881_003347 [Enterococcus termitis]
MRITKKRLPCLVPGKILLFTALENTVGINSYHQKKKTRSHGKNIYATSKQQTNLKVMLWMDDGVTK